MTLVDLLVAASLSMCLCGLSSRLGVRDAPDGRRKLQVRPVATAGGLGVAATLLVGLAVTAHRGEATHLMALALVPALAALLVGLADDARGLSARPKLVLLAVVAAAAAVLGVHVGSPSQAPVPVALVLGGSALWLFVMMNAVNFIDGANGLAMGCALVQVLALSGLGLPVGWFAPALAGFLVWNLSGRLYAGDTGALFVGGLLAGLGALGVREGLFTVWIPPLLALPVLADVFLTLAWRAWRGAQLLEAHREHAYQLLIRAGWSHLTVSALWSGLSVVCALVALAAVEAGPMAERMGFGATLAGLGLLWGLQRRWLGARVLTG